MPDHANAVLSPQPVADGLARDAGQGADGDDAGEHELPPSRVDAAESEEQVTGDEDPRKRASIEEDHAAYDQVPERALVDRAEPVDDRVDERKRDHQRFV